MLIHLALPLSSNPQTTLWGGYLSPQQPQKCGVTYPGYSARAAQVQHWPDSSPGVSPHSSLSPEGTWGWGLPSWCRALGLGDSTPTDSRLMGEQPGLGQEAWVLREGSALAPW